MQWHANLTPLHMHADARADSTKTANVTVEACRHKCDGYGTGMMSKAAGFASHSLFAMCVACRSCMANVLPMLLSSITLMRLPVICSFVNRQRMLLRLLRLLRLLLRLQLQLVLMACSSTTQH